MARGDTSGGKLGGMPIVVARDSSNERNNARTRDGKI